jgi:hypothetical protein
MVPAILFTFCRFPKLISNIWKWSSFKMTPILRPSPHISTVQMTNWGLICLFYNGLFSMQNVSFCYFQYLKWSCDVDVNKSNIWKIFKNYRALTQWRFTTTQTVYVRRSLKCFPPCKHARNYWNIRHFCLVGDMLEPTPKRLFWPQTLHISRFKQLPTNCLLACNFRTIWSKYGNHL